MCLIGEHVQFVLSSVFSYYNGGLEQLVSANYSQTMICSFYMHITLHNYHKEWIH